MKMLNLKKQKLLNLIYIFILIFLILFLFFNKYGLIKYFELKKEIREIEIQIEKSKQEINDLDSSIDLLQKSDAELEKIAREKFLMQKENEKAFKFKDKRDSLK